MGLMIQPLSQETCRYDEATDGGFRSGRSVPRLRVRGGADAGAAAEWWSGSMAFDRIVKFGRDRVRIAAVGTLALLGGTVPSWAHHPLGGEVPSTAFHGFLSGIGHPVIGLDHLAFILAMGVAAWVIGRPILLPLLFIVATVFGTLLHVSSIGLPLVEAVVSLTVLLAGALLVSGRSMNLPITATLFLVAGLFHGHAYGEAVFGAEATPLFAYLFGFGMIQFAIATAAGFLTVGTARGHRDELNARLAGAAVAGVGAVFVSNLALASLGLG